MNAKKSTQRGPSGQRIVMAAAAWIACASLGFAADPPGAVRTSRWGAQAGISEGEELLGKLNCAGCHAVPDEVASRLVFKTPPLLGRVAERASLPWIKHFILDPAATKPGTTMPNLLGALPEAERADAADVLTHYLASLHAWTAPEPEEVDPSLIHEGERLFHTVGCVACHIPQAPFAKFAKSESAATFDADGDAEKKDPAAEPEPAKEQVATAPVGEGLEPSEPLPDLALKARSPGALAAFLADPLSVRPSGRMPSLKLNNQEASAIARYLLRAQAAEQAVEQRLPGLKYEYFERGSFPDAPDFNKMRVKKTGSVKTPNLGPRQRKEFFAFRFKGFITVPASDFYQFSISSDDGSRLYIGDTLVVKNDGHHGMLTKRGVIPLAAGEHPITITYFEAGADSGLAVEWEGPGFKRQPLPESVLSHEGILLRSADDPAFALDAEKAKRGAKLFATLGCANCHTFGEGLEAPAPALAAPAWGALDAAKAGGCLSSDPKPGAPRYALTDAQRASARDAFAETRKPLGNLKPDVAVSRAMARMNCYACHPRGDIGGIEPPRQDYFVSLDDAEMGDEGRLPPKLTGVGGKLLPAALREILTKGKTARTYMAARMPQFGEDNVRALPMLLGLADSIPGDLVEPAFTPELAETGRKLAGLKGFACVQCHTLNGHKSLGIPGLDLGAAHNRLRNGWFNHFLENPISINKGTRMPTFWPDGESPFKDILGGKPRAQMDALWCYLSLGESMRPPEGMDDNPNKYEITPTDGPIIFGVFMRGVGPRTIAVGFPDRVHAAFDADTGRMARLWRGNFINAQSSWEGRAGGVINPVGHDLPPGPALVASEPTAGEAWPGFEKGRQTTGAMRGYTIGPDGNPAFEYEISGMKVRESVSPIVRAGGAGMRRIIEIEGAREGAMFRAATGKGITPGADGVYQIEGAEDARSTVRVAAGGPATLREGPDHTKDLVIKLSSGAVKIELEISWQ